MSGNEVVKTLQTKVTGHGLRMIAIIILLQLDHSLRFDPTLELENDVLDLYTPACYDSEHEVLWLPIKPRKVGRKSGEDSLHPM